MYAPFTALVSLELDINSRETRAVNSEIFEVVLTVACLYSSGLTPMIRIMDYIVRNRNIER